MATLTKLSFLALALFAALSPASAFAQSSQNDGGCRADAGIATSTPLKQATISQIIAAGTCSVQLRNTSLAAAIVRINQMEKIASSTQASLIATATASESTLNTINTTLAGDTSTTTAISDYDSIFNSVRVYALVVPRIWIDAAADRIMILTSDISAVQSTLQTENATADTAVQMENAPLFSDLSTQITTANSDASGSENEVAPLVPDLGNKSILQSNTAALQNAQQMNQGGQTATNAAVSDVKQIIANLKTSTSSAGPDVVLYNPAILEADKQDVEAGTSTNPLILSEYQELLAYANQLVAQDQTYTVTSKTQIPPNGDIHDYESISLYYWPNPNTANGLPWIAKDGQIDPASEVIPDFDNLQEMLVSADALSIAYYLSGNQSYATMAAKVIDTWFVNPATLMNPNFNYAEYIPGVDNDDGQPDGIAENRTLPFILDDLVLLRGSGALSTSDTQAVRYWFDQYDWWLTHSVNGVAAAKYPNNLGTWYDVDNIAMLESGTPEASTSVIQGLFQEVESRIASQILPSGQEPQETVRTKAWDYSNLNLQGLLYLAHLGDNVNVNIWNYVPAQGGGIQAAINYLLPYATATSTWPYQQIVPWDNSTFAETLYRAAPVYSTQYAQDANALPLVTYTPLSLLFQRDVY
jgi:hypothetical protein